MFKLGGIHAQRFDKLLRYYSDVGHGVSAANLSGGKSNVT
jgi:hypothetical protein